MKDKELERIFNDPLFNISEEEKQLFVLPECLKIKKNRNEPDYVGKRVRCENFEAYSGAFQCVQDELRKGKRSLRKFTSPALKAGNYYVSSGQLVFLEDFKNGRKAGNSLKDGRTKIIYEDGTQSDILLHTLRRSLYADGYIVSKNTDNDEHALEKAIVGSHSDKSTGWIYVLKSLSNDPAIKGVENLYKIGFSTVPVEQRIRNAEYEPTYLMDKVKIMAVFETFNLVPHILEHILHKFFAEVQFQLEVYDIDENKFVPKEWFIVPFPIIERVITYIIDGSIVNYKYNLELKVLEKIDNKDKLISTNKIDTSNMDVLTLIIKKVCFDMIIKGDKRIEYRELKEKNLIKYTWVEKDTGSRYLRKFDAIRFSVRPSRNKEFALVEIKNITYNAETYQVEFHLGKILETSLLEIKDKE